MSSQTFARLEKLSSLFIFYISQSFSYPSCTLISLTKTYRLYFSNFLIFLVTVISLMGTYWISQASWHLCALSNLWRVLTFFSLRKQPTFGGATTGFPAKWRLRNWRRNSILMTRHYPDQGSASDWSCRVGNLIQPIRSTTQIWVVTHHQYGISVLVFKHHLGRKLLVALPNVCCFLRLWSHQIGIISYRDFCWISK